MKNYYKSFKELQKPINEIRSSEIMSGEPNQTVNHRLDRLEKRLDQLEKMISFLLRSN